MRFQLKETVYFMCNNKVTTSQILGMQYFGEELRYYIELGVEGGIAHYNWSDEDTIFKTKEDLLKSL